MIQYRNVINQFQNAAQEHLAIKSFGTGTIDVLDALSQDIEYPYFFCRPMTSPGLDLSPNGIGGSRTLTFELYMIDIPHLADIEENIKILNDTEQYMYDVFSYVNFGYDQQVYDMTMINLVPLAEAFEDRATGWLATVQITTPYIQDFCNYPKLP
jgi:hypothetical protein